MGVGVDGSEALIDAAKDRAYRMDVGGHASFVVGEPAEYPQDFHRFDVVCCLRPERVGLDVTEVIRLMAQALPGPDGLLLVATAYWHGPPADDVRAALGVEREVYDDLPGLLARFEAAGLELAAIVHASDDDRDRCESLRWGAVAAWLDEHRHDSDAAAVEASLRTNRRTYLTHGRSALGWGAFVLRPVKAGDVEPLLEPAAVPDVHPDDRVLDVELHNGMIWVRLGDGRIIGNPLAWYPWLDALDEVAQAVYRVAGDAVVWPDAGQRIRANAMLRRGKRP
jgi:SAM-dependent methyltransferase